MVTDAEKSQTSELSKAAESVMPRRGMGVVSCLDSSESADCQSYKAESSARTSQCQCTRSTCRWGARAKPRRRSTWTRKQSQPR